MIGIKEGFTKTFGSLVKKEPILSRYPEIYSPFRPSYGTPNIQKCLQKSGKYKCSAIQWVYRPMDLPNTYGDSRYHYSLFRMCSYDRLSDKREGLLEDVNKWCNYLLEFLDRDRIVSYFSDGQFYGMNMKTPDILDCIKEKGIRANKLRPKARKTVYFGRQEGAWGPQFEFCYKTDKEEVEVGFFADMRFDRRGKNGEYLITNHVKDLYELKDVNYSEAKRSLFLSAIGFERLEALSNNVTFKNIEGWRNILDVIGKDDLTSIKMANVARISYYLLCDGCMPKTKGNMGANRKLSLLLRNLAILSAKKGLYNNHFMENLFNEIVKIARDDYPIYKGGDINILLDYLFGDTMKIYLKKESLLRDWYMV
jgi:hypothetical protein